MKQKTICFIGFFYIRNVTLPLTCIHTAFAKLGGGSAIKIKSCGFYFVLRSPCTTLLRQVRLRLGNKNKNPQAFYFVLRSPCTNFAL